MLRFKNFQKSYGNYPALSIPEFTIEKGICWIKGVNGSGKSTLLKSIAGILFFEGDILLDDVSIKKQQVDYRKLVNFGEAEPLFPEFLTGREFIDLFASAKDAPKGQEQHYLDSMGMNGYVHKPVGSYSSGMLKKLSLLLAFLGKPQLILLDEPLITIDTAALSVLYRWIADHHRQYGTSFLLSSHQILDGVALPAQVLQIENQTLSVANPA
jgi:ABC-2 type transport system ATP-binding protein